MGDSVMVNLMRSLRPISLALVSSVIALSSAAYAQVPSSAKSSFASLGTPSLSSGIVAPARLSPDLALATYEREQRDQSSELAGYTATSLIEAELPGSSQRAQFELKRHYAAP